MKKQQDKYDILKTYYGYDTFRDGQEELIDCLLNGQDVCGIMPTGAGKSVCYQVPALLLPHVTLVVSPLISLMKDQVRALNQMGVHAAYLNSSLSWNQYKKALAYAKEGRYKIIYVAPERLLTEDFLDFAASTPISLLAVDEAHCVSQWGQDFRPSYLKIPEFVRTLPIRPVIGAFTATATREVREDIIRMLELSDPHVAVTGFDRKNLYFEVRHDKDKYRSIRDYLLAHPDSSGVIYCATRKNVEEVCDRLLADGFRATRYHAGLSDEERRANQEAFTYDDAPIMVATNAFGMGIDKSNVRFVLHYNMPKNMESYYQEAGRAGRDGEAADCILLYNGQDVRTAEFLIEHSHESDDDSIDEKTRRALIERDMERLKQMTFYATTTDCLRRYILNYFGEKAPVCCGHCGNCDTNFEEVDATMDARKILSCVYRLDERRLHFGKIVVAAVLTGSKSEQIGRFSLHTLSTYGIMSEQTAVRVRQLIDVLLERGLLTADPERYNALFLTKTGNALMRGRGELHIRLPREKKPETVRRTEELSADVDEKLFEKLRALRTKVAQRAGVPPYVVFSNATLADMAARQPKSEYELLGVRGVGEAKARRYGAEFVDCIRDYLEEN